METLAAVRELRAFNRFYTNLIGVVDRHILESPYSLTEARILYEVAHDPEATTRKIKTFLQVDEGYISRTVAKLVRQGLVTRSPSPADRRAWHLALTPRGAQEFGRLNARSEASIATLIEPLADTERERVLISARTLEVLLGDRARPEVTVRSDLRAGDLGEVIRIHGDLYRRENGYGLSFEAYVAAGVAEFAQRYDPALDRVWICEDRGQMVGFLLVMHRDEGAAQLRYFFLLAPYRGLGLGKRLVGEALDFLRAASYRSAYLWTTAEQTTAIGLYERLGFTLTEEKSSDGFGKPVVERQYSLAFDRPG